MPSIALLRARALAAAALATLAVLPLHAQDGAPEAVPAAAGQDATAWVEEPTEEQIRTAYAAALEDVNARTREHLGAADAGALLIELQAIVKLGCRGLDRAGAQFDCRVERRIRRGDDRPKTDVVELWLSWEDGRWIAR